MKSKLLSNLGLARRAGALGVGMTAVLDDLRRKQAGLVFFASDVSDATAKKLRTSCAYYGVQLRPSGHTMAELSDAVGASGLVGAVSVRRTSILHLF